MAHVETSIKKCIGQIIQQNVRVKNIFDEIYHQGGKVLLVGGAVRDCLLGIVSADLDFEVYHLRFEQLQAVLEQFGAVSYVGKSFGVLRLHGLDVDWSIPRRDSIGRKPQVNLDPNMSYEDAFKRRDVTINAMGINVHTLELIDPYGGLQDLQDKILRAPDVAFFIHDPLRLFRVMQFVGRFAMQPDDALNKVCQTMDLSQVSSERIDAEFTKLFLKSQKPSLGLLWLQKIDRFTEFFTDLGDVAKSLQAIDCMAQHDVEKKLKLSCMWAMLVVAHKDMPLEVFIEQPIMHDTKFVLKQFLRKYVHSLEVVDQAVIIAWYVRYIPALLQQDRIVWYKWLAYWIQPLSLQLLSIVGTSFYDQEVVNLFVLQAQRAEVYEQFEQPLLQGKDLLEYAQGKKLGELVKRAYEIQLHEHFKHKEELKKRIISL